MATTPRRTLQKGILEIVNPTNGDEPRLATDGGLSVTVRYTDEAKEVWAQVYKSSDLPNPLPDSPDATTATKLDPHGTQADRYIGTPPTWCGVEVTVLAWVKINETPEEWVGPVDEENITPQAIVHAKNSLNFAFTSGAINGPEQESGDIYRPVKVKVPAGQNSVDVASLGGEEDLWGHDPNSVAHSTAAGRSGTDAIRQTKDPYFDPAFGSENIEKKEIPLNRLVAMFDVQTTSANVYEVHSVGESDSLNVPGGATLLFLGMHDGREWTNNVFELPIQVDWST